MFVLDILASGPRAAPGGSCRPRVCWRV